MRNLTKTRNTKKSNNTTKKIIFKPKEHVVITKFKKMLDTNPIEKEYMNTMISSIPKKYQAQNETKTLEQLFKKLNNVLTVAPEFNKTALVGTPLSKILLITMGSPEGFSTYRRDKINTMFREVLSEYKKFLDSPDSRYVLNKTKSGWFGKEASKKINMADYQCDTTKPYYGFTSWNNFFTRKFKPGVRPIIEPTNDNVINSACDSTVYRINYNVKTNTKFWIKSQPYSIDAMLNGEQKYIDKFTGGTIYQAFLNPFNYHRWHCPINGTIEKAYVKKGLYFTEVNELGEDLNDEEKSMGYITNVNTRALIFIKADNKKIGTICMMPVGMVEISSCNINKNIKPGHKVKKGDELGFFAYGGSTHCLFFEPNVIKHFKYHVNEFVHMGQIIAEINE
jgi:phosphatidylserine decarboxylase